MADDDATRGQQLLHHAQPEREAEVEPDGMADDLGREAIPGVAGASGCRRRNGGAMVEATVRVVDANVSYKPVHASRGKVVI
jgi:hypothetical protein